MRQTFSRTMRAVEADSSRGYGVAIAATSLLLLLAGVWSAVGFVDVYATSKQGTFETEDLAHKISPQVDGMVTAVNAVLGAHVTAGDVLVELDSEAQQRALEEERTHREASTRIASSLQAQIDTERAARGEAVGALRASAEASSARVAIAKATADYSIRRGDMVSELKRHDLVGGLDSLDAEQSRSVSGAQLHAQQTDARAQRGTGRVNILDRDVRIAGLEHDLASVNGEIATSDARIAELSYEVERRRIRAPISGVIAALATTSPGATIHAGDELGSVVSFESVRVVAFFDPSQSVGRVAPGQIATLRVDQFPWTQYGVLHGVVKSAGTVPVGDLVRVDIQLSMENTRIPILHGLTGSAEVATERLHPYMLLLRLAGQWTRRAT